MSFREVPEIHRNGEKEGLSLAAAICKEREEVGRWERLMLAAMRCQQFTKIGG